MSEEATGQKRAAHPLKSSLGKLAAIAGGISLFSIRNWKALTGVVAVIVPAAALVMAQAHPLADALSAVFA